MTKRTLIRLAAAMGLYASLLIGPSVLGSASAWAGPCATAPVSTYTAPGFSCTVGQLTFSDFTVGTTTTGAGSVALGDFSPYTAVIGGTKEYGFSLTYTASAAAMSPYVVSSTADVALLYKVTSSPGSMVDAYALLNGGGSVSAAALLKETLSNGSDLSICLTGSPSLCPSGSVTTDWDKVTFSPTNNLSATKDQDNIAYSFNGDIYQATSSILIDAFSVTTSSVPEPTTIALFGAGLLSCALFLRRRRLSSR